MANVGVTSAQDGVLTQHPVVVPEMSSFEDVRQAIANVFATFQQSLHSQFPLTNFQGKRITNVAPPTSADDVVTLKYLQSNQPSQQQKTVNPFSPIGSGGSNLWTQAGAALYPTATFTTFVLVGANNTDLSIGAGTIVANAATGSGHIVISAQTNASVFQMTIFGGLCSLLTNKTGTGTTLSMTFGIGGTEVGRWDATSLALFVGTTSTDVAPTKGMIVTTNDYFLVSASSNASTFQMHTGSGVFEFISSSTGIGTLLPIRYVMSATEIARFRINGSMLLGLTSSDVGDNLGWMMISGVFGVVSATTNSTALFLSVVAATETIIHSSFSGSGTVRPLSFYVNGVRRWTIDTNGALLGGVLSSDLSNGNGEIIVTVEVAVITAATNASVIRFIQTAGTANFIQSTATGTGTTLPIAFAFGGLEAARFETTGRLLVGLTSSDAANNLGDLYISNFFGILSATTNATALFMSINGTTETVIHSSFSGTGTVRPLSLYTNGTRAMTVTTGQGVLVGTLSSDVFGSTGQLGANSSVGMYDAATNASFIRLFKFSGSMILQSDHSGTGTNLPLEIWTGGESTAHVRTGGSWLFGMQSSDVGDNLGWIVEQGVFGIVNATTNANALFLSVNGTTETVIHTSFSGAGSALPMSFYASGTRMWTIDTSGVLIGRNLSNGSYGAINGRILTPGDVIITSGYTANENFLRMQIVSGAASIQSDKIGTGTASDLAFQVVGERCRILTTGQFMMGFTSGGDYTGSAGRIVASNDVIVANAVTNSSFIRMIVTASTGELESGRTGTGTFLRMRFVTNATEQATIDTTGRFILGFASSDSGGAGSLMSSFTCGVISAATNAHAILMSVNGTTETVLHSTFSGAGTSLPLSLYVNGIRGMTLTVANPVHVLIGTTTDDGTGALLQVHGTISSNGTVLTVP